MVKVSEVSVPEGDETADQLFVSPQGDEESKIEVSDPKNIGGHTAYNVKGKDGNGEFEVVRRYKEFLAFRDTLIKRFPGFYVPPIPGKVTKKMDKKVINERAYLLNRFMEKISSDQYLWESEEVQLFTRPNQNVKKQMVMLP